MRGGTLVARRGTVVHETMRLRTVHAGDPSRFPRDAAPVDVFADRALIVPRDGERGDSRENGTASVAWLVVRIRPSSVRTLVETRSQRPRCRPTERRHLRTRTSSPPRPRPRIAPALPSCTTPTSPARIPRQPPTRRSRPAHPSDRPPQVPLRATCGAPADSGAEHHDHRPGLPGVS